MLQIGEDPFLSGITDHTRQESGDSGLSVSISQTPDFLSTIDDDSMDGVNANGKIINLLSFNLIILKFFYRLIFRCHGKF